MSIHDETLDGGRFRLQVTRVAPYGGELVVTVAETGEVLTRQDVSLSYEARFGPDVADLDDWREITEQVVDAWLVAHGEEPPL